MTLLAVAGAVLLAGGLVALSHSRFTADLAVIDRAWADVAADLAQRHALVPRLVEVVRGKLRRVDPTLEDVVVARRSAIQAARRNDARISRRAAPENDLSVALTRLLSLGADIGAFDDDPEVSRLLGQLDFLHQRIAADRQVYNLAVQGHNRRVEMAPSRLVAALFGIRSREYLTMTDPVATTVDVDRGPADPARE